MTSNQFDPNDYLPTIDDNGVAFFGEVHDARQRDAEAALDAAGGIEAARVLARLRCSKRHPLGSIFATARGPVVVTMFAGSPMPRPLAEHMRSVSAVELLHQRSTTFDPLDLDDSRDLEASCKCRPFTLDREALRHAVSNGTAAVVLA